MTVDFDLSKHIIGCRNCLGEWIASDKVRRAIKGLMQELEGQIIDGNKLKFSHTIVKIKEKFGEKLI
ncbi:hypothetical protein LCGC14_1538350 [marine sediment metagenome]|uniref:Uncharacterized protein n=1 Tax=marine sediment metagenome TaxID=412755 RepID=A0A0F9JET8_9ZZZZ